jgi:Carboxypeptidase regulatory-like domain/TonB dependent receptor-like, beta-barrel
MKLAMRVLCVYSVLLLITLGAQAQSIATAQLSGTVTDPQGAVVANATVTVRDTAKNFERSTQTNGEGRYQFLLLPPGDYTVNVEAPGFGKVTVRDTLTVGRVAELPISMKVASGETIEVSAQAEIIETQRTSSTNTIQQQRIDNLPINGRNYVNFALTDSQTTRDIAPSIGAAPTSGINFGGQRARSNLVNLDGMDSVDNSVNGIRSTVSQEAVQEFQIIDNGYAAEYGRASGGVVNIVTRSGANAFHGTAFAFLRHKSIQAVNPFSTVPDPAYTRVQPGFTLSGPLVKDRTFWFLSYETTRRQETGFSTIGQDNFGLVPFNASAYAPFGIPGTVLMSSQQAQALTGLTPNVARATYLGTILQSQNVALRGAAGSPVFPGSTTPLPPSFMAVGSLVGNYPISEGTSVYSLRLDHRLNNAHQLMLRANVSPSTATGIQVNAQNQNFGQNAFSRTSQQTYRDVAGTAQHTWIMGNNKVNEFRFQFARRGLRYDFSHMPDTAGDTDTVPDGSEIAINMPGVAFFGREPFSFVDRVEKRYQFVDNFSWVKGDHNFKFGTDINYLPLTADFTVNFGALFNFGQLSATSVNSAFAGLPAFTPLQSYGLGIPQSFVQGVGNPHDEFHNTPLAFYAQDSWRIRRNLTLNYGVRYDVELTQEFAASNQIAGAAQQALGITQGIPRDTNNVAPRIGIAWDPTNDGKTVIRAAYGIFYDHPLLALAFDSDVADGTQAPQIILGGGAPCTSSSTFNPANLNATNVFRGTLTAANCFPVASLGYLPQEQRFDAFFPNSAWVNQNYLTQGIPLSIMPFGFPTASNFEYAYSHQANFAIERDLGGNFSLGLGYNFNGGRHLNRPINVNPVRTDILVANWERAVAAGAISPTVLPISVTACGVGPAGPFVPAAVTNFFRPSGVNPVLFAGIPAGCQALVTSVLNANGLGSPVTVPFSDMVANFSNGSSVYHGATLNLRKRFSSKYEFLASYTWSHTIDDSTDLQSLLAPQNSFDPSAERSNSTFDQRHRFVLSGVYQSGRLAGDGAWSKILSDWTVAPIVEISSGRPFNILVGADQNFDFGPNTDRPVQASQGQTTPCGNTAVPSRFSPTGFIVPACFIDGVFNGVASAILNGNLGRNAGLRPYTVFTDLRVSRRIRLTERVSLEGVADMFNLINKFNVADVNPLWNNPAGTPTAAYDPRQFQFAVKLSF